MKACLLWEVISQFFNSRNFSPFTEMADISSFSYWLTGIFYYYKSYRGMKIYASAIFHVLVNLHIFYV